MKLNGEQRAVFTKALLSAFPNRDKLQQMVSFGLDENLAALTSANDLQQAVFELIEWAAATNKTRDLLRAALTANADNSKLRKFAAIMEQGENQARPANRPKGVPLNSAELLDIKTPQAPPAPESDLSTRYPNLPTKLAEIGISDLWRTGDHSLAEWGALRKAAHSLDLLTISARSWIYGEGKNIEELIFHNHCNLRVILAQPNTDFVALREKRENRRPGTIDVEIEDTVKELVQITKVVESRGGDGGSLEIRYCVGDITARIEIIDHEIIHWTPHILPVRAIHMPAFKLELTQEASVSRLLINYFNLIWHECSNSVVYIWRP